MNCPRCGADDIRVMGETDGGKLFVVSGLAVMVTREELEAAVAQEDAESDD
jgi:hypothetical protein